jgi:hypothetical protein
MLTGVTLVADTPYHLILSPDCQTTMTVLTQLTREGMTPHVSLDGEYLGVVVGVLRDDFLIIDRYGVPCRYGPAGLRYATADIEAYRSLIGSFLSENGGSRDG